MSRKVTEKQDISLGEYLRETRVSLGLDMATIAEETRISYKSLQAIEENDFAVLPAEAFTRGFYALYAKSLSLCPEDVLQRYAKERPEKHRTVDTTMQPPSKLAQEVSNMAERPSFLPFSLFGLILLLLLVVGGFLCWYFAWNPAIYLSQKLRSLEPPQRIEQASFGITSPPAAEAPPFTPLSSKVDTYYLGAELGEGNGIDDLLLSEAPVQSHLLEAGKAFSWPTEVQTTLFFPTQPETKLTLNILPHDLPDPNKEEVTLRLPEQLLL